MIARPTAIVPCGTPIGRGCKARVAPTSRTAGGRHESLIRAGQIGQDYSALTVQHQRAHRYRDTHPASGAPGLVGTLTVTPPFGAKQV